MKLHNEKKAKTKLDVEAEDYEKKREKLLELCGTEIDAPIIKPQPTPKMIGGYLEELKVMALASNIPFDVPISYSQLVINDFPPPFDDHGEETVRYVDDDALARKMKKCFGG
jgi:hypothetical protein